MARRSYPKQAIMPWNKMEKVMNRNNGEYRVLTWKTSSQMETCLTPSIVFCSPFAGTQNPSSTSFILSLDILNGPPTVGFPPSITSNLPPSFAHVLSCFYLLPQATTRFTTPCLGKMSSSTTALGMVKSLTTCPMLLVCLQKEIPPPT